MFTAWNDHVRDPWWERFMNGLFRFLRYLVRSVFKGGARALANLVPAGDGWRTLWYPQPEGRSGGSEPG